VSRARPARVQASHQRSGLFHDAPHFFSEPWTDATSLSFIRPTDTRISPLSTPLILFSPFRAPETPSPRLLLFTSLSIFSFFFFSPYLTVQSVFSGGSDFCSTFFRLWIVSLPLLVRRDVASVVPSCSYPFGPLQQFFLFPFWVVVRGSLRFFSPSSVSRESLSCLSVALFF